jgi:hypothetical protein
LRGWNEEIAPQYPLTTRAGPRRCAGCSCAIPCRRGFRWCRRRSSRRPSCWSADGTETGRIEGYPGEEFFWPLLADMIEKAATN